METATRTIIRVNNVEIVSTNEGLIPIRPICEALGVDHKAQREKIKEHYIFGSVGVLSTSTGKDGKQYEMLCIPAGYVLGWLLTINPANVKEEVRGMFASYQAECYNALYRHFFGSQRRQLEQNQVEIALLEQLADYTQQREEANNGIRDTRRKLERLRQERLADEPQLFG